ncbi:MAG: cell wall hydrolase [Alphaproteobacteria bacterium]
MTDKEKEIDLMARTMWGEARGEGIRGMQAVANVIMNRVNAGRWYGRTVEDVVLKPYQFSCWNANDPNLPKLKSVNEKDTQFSNAKGLARLAYEDNLVDITGGATHYHAAGITPYWANAMNKTAVIGNHAFYKGA